MRVGGFASALRAIGWISKESRKYVKGDERDVKSLHRGRNAAVQAVQFAEGTQRAGVERVKVARRVCEGQICCQQL